MRETPYWAITRGYVRWAMASGAVLALAGSAVFLLGGWQSPRFVPVWVLSLALCLCRTHRLGMVVFVIHHAKRRASRKGAG